eukprot:m.337296 g.337296  ORF g.337296 m.337296 type:complete len:579 (+) comp18097_c0_seq1:203-1939(+)
MCPRAICLLLAALLVSPFPKGEAFLFQPTTSLGDTDTSCAVCTALISVLEQLAVVHNNTIDKEVEKICDLFPQGSVRKGCIGIIALYGPTIINLIEKKETADVVCRAIDFCSNDHQCHLFPSPSEGIQTRVKYVKMNLVAKGLLPSASDPPLPKFCKIPGLEELCKKIFGFGNNHLPIEDSDNDGFSGHTETLRGTDWRGKDCVPDDRAQHPGAKPIDADKDSDSNCNGIAGVNPATGVPYETELCEGTNQMGVAVLGDSASAHFHVPPTYLNATAINNHTYQNIEFILENEFDWPELSSMTGYFNSTQPFPDIHGHVNSTYMVNRHRNRCAHRDFQNLGVNGARAGAMNTTIQQGLSRDPQSDLPLLVYYALIGNDVCNGHNDTVAHMTLPDDFRKSAIATLSFLNNTLPKGSQVVMMGLVDGRVLYEGLHNRTHPIGALRNDVTYKDLYAYLNCLGISPCTGWMNANATLRNLTTQRAEELSGVLSGLVDSAEDMKLNFGLHYMENPVQALISKFISGGGQIWELIEPVDGFHPNQDANALIADAIVDFLNSKNILPPVNPNNEKIISIFGDQGGY